LSFETITFCVTLFGITYILINESAKCSERAIMPIASWDDVDDRLPVGYTKSPEKVETPAQGG
jgi:hypothetical protein